MSRAVELAAYRGLGLQITRVGKFTRLAGAIDEFADYGPLLEIKGPLHLSLRDIVAINAIGMMRWALFVRAVGDRRLHIHECPLIFLDALLLLPQMASPSGDTSGIRSIVLPINCASCGEEETHRVVAIRRGRPLALYSFSTVACRRCGNEIVVEEPSHEALQAVV